MKSIISTISRQTTCASETELRKTKNEVIEQAKKVQFRTSGSNPSLFVKSWGMNHALIITGTVNVSIGASFCVHLVCITIFRWYRCGAKCFNIEYII